VIGDSGTGKRPQLQTAEQMSRCYSQFPFEIALMLGDNLYGSEKPGDYRKKFEIPYRSLLDAGVLFYAVLGNHDDADQTLYPAFHMHGRRYYFFPAPRQSIRFFALDSTQMTPAQMVWLETALSQSSELWKVCLFHHPIYSSGRRHGADLELRALLEPLFVKYGVQLAFAGHDHLYERLKPQQGIHYFISGAAGQLRRNGLGKTELTAASFDQDRSYMLVEISGDACRFYSVSRTGLIVDEGAIHRIPTVARTAAISLPESYPTPSLKAVSTSDLSGRSPVPH
jgi:hypothetical protein